MLLTYIFGSMYMLESPSPEYFKREIEKQRRESQKDAPLAGLKKKLS